MEQNQKKKKPQLTNYSNYTKYSGMAVQMAAIIFLGVYGGFKIDKELGFKKIPVFTLVLSLGSVFLAIYFSIKDFIKKK